MKIPYYHVDAFACRIFTGNPQIPAGGPSNCKGNLMGNILCRKAVEPCFGRVYIKVKPL